MRKSNIIEIKVTHILYDEKKIDEKKIDNNNVDAKKDGDNKEVKKEYKPSWVIDYFTAFLVHGMASDWYLTGNPVAKYCLFSTLIC